VTLSTFRDQSCLACQDMQRRLDAVVLDLENAEAALRAERRKVNGLQKQMAAQHLSSPLLSDARALFEFWQAQCHHPRSVFDAQRQRLAVQRLAEHGADRLHDRGLDVFLTGCLACGAGDGLYRPFSFRLTDKLVGSCGACAATEEDLHA
jgi:hypothetical protein